MQKGQAKSIPYNPACIRLGQSRALRVNGAQDAISFLALGGRNAPIVFERPSSDMALSCLAR